MNSEPKNEIIKKLLDDFSKKKYTNLEETISELQIKNPNSIFLFNLLGAIQNELKNYDKAIYYYNKIIKINKNFADAYYNLGVIYKKIYKIDKSIYNYNKCLEINSKKFEAYNNLGNIYRDKDDIEKAIKNYLICLEINSNYLIALQNFGICLQNYNLNNQSDIVNKHIINLLEKNNILRPVDIVKSLINYLYLNLEFKEIVENVENLNKKYSIEVLINKILKEKIFILLLQITPIVDLKIENFLKYLRKEILLNISLIKNTNSALDLVKIIAKQCFINEYIYTTEQIEETAIKKLDKEIENTLKKNNLSKLVLKIACLAAYKSLDYYNWSNKINNLHDISDLVDQQINEPELELSLRKDIISRDINNAISVKVKNQYENNPYPRWTKIALNNSPEDVINYAYSRNLNIEIKEVKKWDNINVLVAGCGTGQHAITTATKYKNSYVTAIDLSLKSLSYAKRKADELNINNIEFIEMDILDLKNYRKNFEIIESVGVLHHMNEPITGWQILSDILKPNGLLMIGLYSEKARQHIKRIRSTIKNLNYEINDKNIKLLRNKIIITDKEDNNLIKDSTDFYSMSTLRDLLFHVQEHTFSIPQILQNINKLDLKFCGFENRHVLNLFKKIYKRKEDAFNLNLWNEFENNNQRIFAGMYQFWCQKK